MSWEARKYKDIIDTLTGNLMQLELNIKAIEGYAHILNSKTLDGIIEDTRENISDIKSDIKDEWHKRHFKNHSSGVVYCWEDGKTSFTTDKYEYWNIYKFYKEGDK